MAAIAPQIMPARITRGTPLQALQTKLEVGSANDIYEREADSVAAQVIRGGEAAVAIPPTITPLTAQRKAFPKKLDEEKKSAAKPTKAQRKAPPTKREEDKKPTKKAQRKKRDEDQPKSAVKGRLQREAAAGAQGGTASTDVSSTIASMQAGSAPGIDGSARGFMESRFGRDFGEVRVHHGSSAAAAADALGARAFTVGNDIFFNRGQYQPHSSSGRSLLAHELTHTVQQTGGHGLRTQRRIQRKTDSKKSKKKSAGEGPAGGGADGAAPASTEVEIPGFRDAKIDTADVGGFQGNMMGTITLPALGLPSIAGKLKGTSGGKEGPWGLAAENRSVPTEGATNFELKGPLPEREKTVAADVWTAGARKELKDGLSMALTAMKDKSPERASIADAKGDVFYLTFKGKSRTQKDNIFIGSIAELADSDALLRPQWSPSGSPASGRTDGLQADHFLEAQLGGRDSAENMWLLKGSYNMSVGAKIMNNIQGDLGKVIKAAAGMSLPEGEAPDASNIDRHWNVRFTNVGKGSGFAQATTIFWTREDIATGKHLQNLTFMTNQDLVDANIRLEKGKKPKGIDVYPTSGGGRRASFPLKGDKLSLPGFFFSGLKVESATYFGDAALGDPSSPVAELTIRAFRKKDGTPYLAANSERITVKRNPRLGIAGYVDPEAIRAKYSKSDFPGLSPLTLSELALDDDGVLRGRGTITSSKAMLPGLPVPMVLEGEDIGINHGIPFDGINLGPVQVTEASLGLGFGDKGIFLNGAASFHVSTLGNGWLTAQVGKESQKIAGHFDLATDFFTPASIDASYDLATDEFAASATLGVEAGRIPGVESGTVTVDFNRNALSFDGSLTLGGPLRGIIINVTYGMAQGLRIGADNIPLPISNLPAVQNATLSIAAAKAPNATDWSFSGKGSATFGVPGVTGGLEVEYLDGAVTIHGQGQVEKGPAKGTLDFTATNRQIDETGRPIEGPPGDRLTGWGKGTVTVKFGEVLSGTAGIELTPDNRVIVSGTIAMPPVYEVFDRRDYNKDLFTLCPPEFPIWGVSLAGVGVGVFAFVDARVFFEAYVGPAQIRDAAVTATLDLDKPEEAKVSGHGEFYVPAYAGLGLDVGGGLRARAAIAFAEGRVGLIGKLGIDAGAGATIDFIWNRSEGLALEAPLHAEATPKFELSANASVTVGVDLLLTEVSHTFGPWSKELGSFGPDMTLGVKMPVKWSEARGLDMNLDNIEITRPQLDAASLMGDVFDRLAG